MSKSSAKTRSGRRRLEEALRYAEENVIEGMDDGSSDVAKVNKKGKAKKNVKSDKRSTSVSKGTCMRKISSGQIDQEVEEAPMAVKKRRKTVAATNKTLSVGERRVGKPIHRAKSKLPKAQREKRTVMVTQAQINSTNGNSTEVEFIEEGDRVLMAVDGQDEENFGIGSETMEEIEGDDIERYGESDDDEVPPLAAYSDEELEVEFNIRGNGRDSSRSEPSKDHGSDGENVNDLSQEEKRRRIKLIDKEMKQKLEELQKLMNSGGLEESAQLTRSMIEGTISVGIDNTNMNANINGIVKTTASGKLPLATESEETIYRNAVKRVGDPPSENSSNRFSSSSDEGHNVSDELMDLQWLFDNFTGKRSTTDEDNRDQIEIGQGCRHGNQRNAGINKSKQDADDRSENIIREAEAVKGHVYAYTGKNKDVTYKLGHSKERIHSMLVDEEYSAIGSHLDESIVNKIKDGTYVDFTKLLPRD